MWKAKFKRVYCRDCEYFEQTLSDKEHDPHLGDCKRYPTWLRKWKVDWCGEGVKKDAL
jgi:hypothetical protein